MGRVHQVRPARLGPADRVTLVRAVLAGAVTLLVAASFVRPVPVPALVTLAAIGLALDAVDGWVARRTHTVTARGARFDMEVDAFLILVLSVYVARTTAWWVLAIGLARYVFVAAGRVVPRLRGAAPPRRWCKVVAALQGIVLTVAAADVLPLTVMRVLLAVALLLLAESFGREAWQLTRGTPGPGWPELLTAVACAVVWLALVVPNPPKHLALLSFARVPVEALLIILIALVLRGRVRRLVLVGAGLVLAVLVVLTVLDIGFFAVFDRPFDLLNDAYYLRQAPGVLTDSSGHLAAVAVVVLVALLVVGMLVLMPWAVLRVGRLVTSHRRPSTWAVTVLGVVWVLAATTGLQPEPRAPTASTSASARVLDQVTQVRADLHDRKVFAADIAEDRFKNSSDLLAGLRGKDVVLAFVESYGRVAVQGSSFSPGVDAVLDDGTRRLDAAGFSSRSAFLTSPTYGAGSWLAHSSLQSGLWVDSQQRYNQLLTRDRLTLTSAFERAGWRTVFNDPAITKPWPEGARFYGFDQSYDAHDVGYRGPRFSYATMPDQYTLEHFRRQELARKDRPRVMAEIDLVSSHHPWAPLPTMVPWKDVGDGSVFDGMPARGDSPEEVFRDPDRVRAAYGRSIEYTLTSLISFVETYRDPDLVLVLVGDHQPHKYVSGEHQGHDVPITIIAHDPAVMARISGWGWQAGMNPGADAPVLRMDRFRDAFLNAFG